MVRSFATGDLQELSVVLNLFDPVTLKRFTHPARGKRCVHRSAFELESFLQQPFRRCPICSRHINPRLLLVDGFISEILSKTQESCREVTLAKDGTWAVGSGSKRPGAQVVILLDSDAELKCEETTVIENPEPNGSDVHQRTGSRIMNNESQSSRSSNIPPINGQIPEISSSSTSSRSVLSSRVRIQNPESEGSDLQNHMESTESDPRSSSALPNGQIPETSGSSTSSRSVSSGIPRIQNPESEGSTLQTHRGYAESDPRSSLRSRLCDNSSGCTYVFDRSVTQRSHKVPQASQDNQSSSIENGLINGIIVESAQIQLENANEAA
eukprot:327531_1